MTIVLPNGTATFKNLNDNTFFSCDYNNGTASNFVDAVVNPVKTATPAPLTSAESVIIGAISLVGIAAFLRRKYKVSVDKE
ncbi:hypothetical protein QUF50_01955 [Thiotrichales bacterium HSG1]|nr:hypothetical protein [Thiotrichales bacterium HSG1]